jgi:hypothetical protein
LRISVLWVGKNWLTGVLRRRLRSVWLREMYKRLAVVFVASTIGLGACTTAGGTPATAPPITEAPGLTIAALPTTTTMPITTTTLDRLAEIQAIFQDLEVRRLQAIMDQDEVAFRAVFANDEYAERSMVELDLVTVLDPRAAEFSVTEVHADTPECIAVGAVVNASQSTKGGGIAVDSDYVIEISNDRWGYSWIGEGWRCIGSHPFSY